tara:strand:- start:725 stop:1519 length:795 start_codon:yes stop_codon:yes gene_type:complete
MPNINLPNFPYVDGASPNGEQLTEQLYDPTAANGSYETMNGGLDAVNRDPSWTKIQQNQVQGETFTSAQATAGTTNLDYFPEQWFGDVTVGLTFANGIPSKFFQPVPGANSTFYLPWDGYVIFTWSIVWGGEQWDTNLPAYMVLLIDNQYDITDASQRFTTRSLFLPDGSGPYNHWAELKNRHWQGHFTKYLQKGWHTSGLSLITNGQAKTPNGASAYVQDPEDPGVPGTTLTAGGVTLKNRPKNRQIRVFVRSFKHIAFRGIE